MGIFLVLRKDFSTYYIWEVGGSFAFLPCKSPNITKILAGHLHSHPQVSSYHFLIDNNKKMKHMVCFIREHYSWEPWHNFMYFKKERTKNKKKKPTTKKKIPKTPETRYISGSCYVASVQENTISLYQRGLSLSSLWMQTALTFLKQHPEIALQVDTFTV